MAELQTKRNKASVKDFLSAIHEDQKRTDSFRINEIMSELSGDKPEMWGPSIVGFGSQHYTYKSGREGDWMRIGFSPRKASITLYFMDGLESHSELLERLGKHTTSKGGCLYIKKLSDINEAVLKQLIASSLKNVEEGVIL